MKRCKRLVSTVLLQAMVIFSCFTPTKAESPVCYVDIQGAGTDRIEELGLTDYEITLSDSDFSVCATLPSKRSQLFTVFGCS